MRQRFRLYLTLILWLGGALGILAFSVSKSGAPPDSQQKMIGVALFSLPLLDLWRKVRSVTVSPSAEGLELRRGGAVIANYSFDRIQPWSSVRSLSMLVRMVALAAILLVMSMVEGANEGWNRSEAIVPGILGALLVAAAFYDHFQFWTMELVKDQFPASTSLTLHRRDFESLFGNGPWSGAKNGR